MTTLSAEPIDYSARLREVADWAEVNHAHHDQGSWIHSENYPVPVAAIREGSCGTSACSAGIAAVLYAPSETEVSSSGWIRLPGQHVSTPVSEFGQEALGLDGDQAGAIFYTEEETAIARLRYLADHPGASAREICQAVRSPWDTGPYR